MIDELGVYYGSQRVGGLTRQGREVAFQYDDGWRHGPSRFALSMSMPLTRATHTGDRVVNFIDGLMPDNLAVREQWSRRFHVDAKSPFDLLCHVGMDVAGAVRYMPESPTARTSSTPWTPFTTEQIEVFIRRGQEEAATWGIPGTAGRFSLAGQQSKMAVVRFGNDWYPPSEDHPSTHILKPGLVDYDRSAECEYLTMRLAAELGLPVAQVEMLELGNLRAVAVARFDREVLPDGTVRRIHQEDLCQALGLPPSLRYESSGGPGVREFGRLLSALEASHAIAAKSSLFDALAFNWLTLGTDAHAKNYSIQHLPGIIRFAPLYDLMSAAPYPAQLSVMSRDTRTAQKLGGEDRFRWIQRRHWERAARDLGRNPSAALDRAHELAEALPAAIGRVAANSSGVPEDFVSRWAETLESWVKSAARNLAAT